MKVRQLARQIVEFYEKISSWENSVVKERRCFGATMSFMWA